MTGEQRRLEFMLDFKALLVKHAAEFSVTLESVDWDNYPCADISMNGVYDADGNTIKEPVYFELPKYISCED